MIKEITESEFAKGVKNPYFEKLNRKVEVAIRHENYEIFCKIAQFQDNVTPEMIMSRCLADYAKMLQDDEE